MEKLLNQSNLSSAFFSSLWMLSSVPNSYLLHQCKHSEDRDDNGFLYNNVELQESQGAASPIIIPTSKLIITNITTLKYIECTGKPQKCSAAPKANAIWTLTNSLLNEGYAWIQPKLCEFAASRGWHNLRPGMLHRLNCSIAAVLRLPAPIVITAANVQKCSAWQIFQSRLPYIIEKAIVAAAAIYITRQAVVWGEKMIRIYWYKDQTSCKESLPEISIKSASKSNIVALSLALLVSAVALPRLPTQFVTVISGFLPGVIIEDNV